MKVKGPRFMIRLWAINRVLRWTGFRLVVGWPDTDDGWVLLGLKFWGWRFVTEGEQP